MNVKRNQIKIIVQFKRQTNIIQFSNSRNVESSRVNRISYYHNDLRDKYIYEYYTIIIYVPEKFSNRREKNGENNHLDGEKKNV